MTPSRFEKIQVIYRDARSLDPTARPAFLDLVCENDASLRNEVESLLRVGDDVGSSFMDQPALGSQFTLDDNQLDEVQELSNLAQVGQYQVLRPVGFGGMGIVYQAKQQNPRRTVALKLIRPGLASSQMLLRFKHEAHVLAHLRHPGVAQVYEAGWHQTKLRKLPFIAMEFIDGSSLLNYVRQNLSNLRERLTLFMDICKAVHHAHQKGIIHRDLKPGNILIDTAGEKAQPKIVDFGIARITNADLLLTTLHTEAGQLMGTMQYMSPEQVEGSPEKIDVRSDVYALGVILYELLTDRLPYDLRAITIPQALRIICEESPPKPSIANQSIHPDLETITLKALEKKPGRRYQSVQALIEDVDHYLSDREILARPRTFTHQFRKLVAQRKVPLLLLPLVLVFLTVLAAQFEWILVRKSETGERSNTTKKSAVLPFAAKPTPTVPETVRLTASDAEAGDFFGGYSSISGEVVLIGAPRSGKQNKNAGSAYIFRYDGVDWREEAQLIAPDGTAHDQFGYDVSISGNIAMIGARHDDDQGQNSGSVYVYRFDGKAWIFETKLLPSDGSPYDAFGSRISIDNDVAMIGTTLDSDFGTMSGSVYAYRYDAVENTWNEEAKLNPADAVKEDYFGRGIAIKNNVAVIGASGNDDAGKESGSAYVFRYEPATGSWAEEAKLTAADASRGDEFGVNVAISGDLIAVGAWLNNDKGLNSGAVYLFRYDPKTTQWIQETKLTASNGREGDQFGVAVAIAEDGSVIVAADHADLEVPNAGAAYIFQFDGTDWIETNRLVASDATPGDGLGRPSTGGNWIMLCTPLKDDAGVNSGAAYLFDMLGRTNNASFQSNAKEQAKSGLSASIRTKPTIHETFKLTASDAEAGDFLGSRTSISGDVVLAGALLSGKQGTNAGSAYIFRYDGNDWLEEARLTAPDGKAHDQFGVGASINGNVAIVGARRDNDRGLRSGSAYVYRFDGDQWTFETKISASDGSSDDSFGISISLDNDIALISAPHDDDFGMSSGSVYAYQYDAATKTWKEKTKLNPADASKDDRFGSQVFFRNNVAVIGAPYNNDAGKRSGSAYVFRHDPIMGRWKEEAKLMGSDSSSHDQFGMRVTTSGDLAVIGSLHNDEKGPDSGAAYIFRHDPKTTRWIQEAKLTASDGRKGDQFGSALAIAEDGSVIVTAKQADLEFPNAGVAYVFQFDGTDWVEVQRLVASDAALGDALGWACATSGDWLVVSTPLKDDAGISSGAIYLFKGFGATGGAPPVE
ncbi:MAG: protein kinase [Phycisphaerales bacterium]|nr:protein kinase [Phycisphaerales bacterium]